MFDPHIDAVVEAVEAMLRHRAWPCEEYGGPSTVALHIKEALAVTGTPVWWTPARESFTFITNTKKIPIQAVRDLWNVVQASNTQHVHTLEFVTQYPITSLGNTQDPCFVVVAWNAIMLRPLDHCLVPRQAVVPRALCPWPVTDLPRILRTDPIVRYLGMRPGEILRVERAAGDPEREHIYWRVVV